MCLTHFIGFGSLARSQIKDWKMKRKYILGKWVKMKSFNDTPAGGSNVTSHKACLGRTHKLVECRKITFPLPWSLLMLGKESFPVECENKYMAVILPQR